MSDAFGHVVKDGKIVAYFEYAGTADVVIPDLYDSYDELQAHWRKEEWKKCNCGKEPEEVLLYSDYGGGFYWPGKVCLPCHAIVDGFFPFGDQFYGGWGGIKDREGYEAWKAGGWPKDGHPIPNWRREE